MKQAYDEMPASSGDDEISVVQLTRLMWRSRRLIAAVILICGIIAAVISLLLPPIYTARVSLLPRDQGTQQNLLGQLASLTNMQLGNGSTYEDLYGQIITSNRVLDRILDEQWSRYAGDEPKPLMELLGSHKRPDASVKTWAERERFKSNLRRQVISFERRAATGYMQISVSLPRWPELAAELANALAGELDAYLQEMSRGRASEQRRFISDRLDEIRIELDAAASSLADFESQNRSFASSPLLSRRHTELTRDLQVQTAVWIELKRQLEIAKIDENKDVIAIEVLDSATVPFVRSAPSRSLITLGGAALGFVLACGWVLVRGRPAISGS